ncbi:helix-turn-helix domain-containing protein [Peribacillus sp. NPDC097295]|uniref:helix-turn-helix domain-containing protein n=1 Tax=Peribacillus sp. NPDC097295 TaxID=3364402 RepID=UPI003821A930
METLGERIKQKRKELGLRQEDLSGPFLSPAIISLIERGKSNPSLKTLEIIASKLGVNVNYLVDGDMVMIRSEPDQALNILKRLISNEKLIEAKELSNDIGKMELSFVEKGIFYKLESQICMADGEFEIAIEKLNNALLYLTFQQLDDFVEVYFLKSECYFNTSNYDLAITNASNGLLLLNSNFSSIETLLKLKLLYILSYGYCRKYKFKMGLSKINEALIYMKETNFSYLKGKFYMLKGLAHLYLDEYKDGIEYSQQALRILQKEGEPNDIAGCYTNQGILFRECGDYQQSLIELNKAFKLAIDIGNTKLERNTLFEMSLTYLELKNYDKALAMLKNIVKSFKDTDRTFDISMNIKCILLQSFIKIKTNDLKEALRLANEAESLVAHGEEQFVLAKIYTLKSKIFKEKGDIDKTFEVMTKALNIYEKEDSHDMIKFFNKILSF